MKRTSNVTKSFLRGVRHARIRATVRGTKEMPRLSVHRGLKSVTAQLVDDEAGKTICFVKSSSLKVPKVEGKSAKVAAAYATGEALAKAATEKGVKKVVFDRGGYQYHGRVAAVAEGARAGGLQF